MTRTQRVMYNLGIVGERATKKIRAGFERAAASAAELNKKLSSVGGVLAGLGVAELTRRMIGQAASFQQTQIRLKVLSEEYGEFSKIQELVRKNAKTFNQSLAESSSNFANVFARLRPLGIELSKIQTVYEGFNAVAIASGTSAQAASVAFLQLSQALGSGRLQGDEFRSVSEQVPHILKLVADEMGVTVGQLKQLGSEGKITSDILINALAVGFEKNKDKIKELLNLSPAQKFKEFSNAVSELNTTIGGELLPTVTPFVNLLTEIAKIFGRMPGFVKTTASALLGLGAAFISASAGAKLLGIEMTKAGLFKLAALAGKVSLLAAPFLGLAAAFEDAQRRKKRLDEALESDSLNKVQDQLNQSVKELNGLIDGLRIVESSPYFKGQTAEVSRLKTEIEKAAKQVDLLTKRRDLIIDLKLNVPFPDFDIMGAGFSEELKKELNKLGLSYVPGEEVKPIKKKGDQVSKQKVDISQKVLDLNLKLLAAQESEQKRLAATLALMVEKENILQSGLQPREEELRMAQAMSTFRQEIKGIDKEIADQRASDIEKAAEGFEAQMAHQDELRQAIAEQKSAYEELNTTFRNGIVDSILVAVEGTKSLKDSLLGVIKSMARLILQQQLMNALGGFNLFGGGGGGAGGGFGVTPATSGLDFSGAFANGGRPAVGKAALVGERGPELFVPDRAGTIIPNSALGGANVVVNVDASGSNVQGDGQQGKALGQAIGAAVQAELIKQKRPGGLLS